ncbi:MAG: hypothetical protein WCD56_06680 [Pseudolabrys sp.]|jgi:putative ABC transport system substrate-binding protein
MQRREFITLIGGAAAWPLTARAQQATKMPRIGVLAPGRSDNSDASLRTLNAFIPALGELGYTEGRNIAIERKFAEGDADRLRALATELVERLSRSVRRPPEQPSKRPPQSLLSQ